MKLFKRMTWNVLLVSCFAVFTACSSDDDNGGDIIPTVKQLKSVSDMTMSYKDGLLTRIVTEDGKHVTFDYVVNAKTKTNSEERLKMIIEYDDDPEDIRYFDMLLNSNGFIKSCIQTYADNEDIDTWEFKYNTDGQLIYMKRSEGGNEVTTIKYENGNITEVSMISEEDEDRLNTKIFYTTNEISIPIDNKNNIMLFDVTFGIDMDEMKYAYWAGLLGKATKYLPVKITYVENSEEDETETFQWNIKDNYIQKMTQNASWGKEEHLFTWE